MHVTGEVLDDPNKAFVRCMPDGKWNISDGIWPQCVKSKSFFFKEIPWYPQRATSWKTGCNALNTNLSESFAIKI